MEIILIVVVAALVLAAAAFAWHLERKRTAELSALASRLGLSFDRDRDPTTAALEGRFDGRATTTPRASEKRSIDAAADA